MQLPLTGACGSYLYVCAPVQVYVLLIFLIVTLLLFVQLPLTGACQEMEDRPKLGAIAVPRFSSSWRPGFLGESHNQTLPRLKYF